MIGDVLLEFFAADTLDDVSSESKSIIGIGRNFARRKNARWHLVHEIGAQRFHVAFVRHEEIFQRLLESARREKFRSPLSLVRVQEPGLTAAEWQERLVEATKALI